jgi:tetratricopeptide (TPR) repeat protein
VRRWKGPLILLGLIAIVTAGGVIAYRLAKPTADSLLGQARTALDHGDRREAVRLARLLERQGHEDHARLVRGEALVRDGRVALERAATLTRSHETQLGLQMLLDGAAWCGLPTAPLQVVYLHQPRTLPPLLALSPWMPQRLELDARARTLFEEAVAEFRKLQEQALVVEGAALAGECLVRLRELGVEVPPQETVKALTFVIEHNPDHLAAHRWLASTYIDLHAIPYALRHLQEWGRLDPADGRPFRWLGFFHYKDQEHYGEAIEAYLQALARRLEPAVRAEVARELAEVWVESRANFQAALDALAQCPEPYAQEPEVVLLRAECLDGLGRHAEAVALAEKVLRTHPDLHRAVLLRGKMYLDEDRPRAALPLLEKAVRLDPYDPRGRHQLAAAYELLGDVKRAEEQRQASAKLKAHKDRLVKLHLEAINQPWNDHLRYELAVLFLQVQRVAEARVWLRAAVTCNPNNQQARQLWARLTGLDPASQASLGDKAVPEAP